jgi:hypothetical protein
MTPSHGVSTHKGAPAIPRIVEHEPRPGDIHPVTRSMLLRLLAGMGPHLLKGVSRIELRARVSPDVGNPHGTYSPRDEMIRLFSVPFPDWPCELEVLSPRSRWARFGATLIFRDGQPFIHWTRVEDLARYYFVVVFAHELGHHYVYRHRRYRSLPQTMRGHEQRANRIMWHLGAARAFRREFGMNKAQPPR